MEVGEVLDISREALVTTLIIAAPVLAAGLLVGIVVSLLQTLTQLQDQTLSIVPKIVAMVGAAILLSPWLAEHLIAYARTSFGG